MDVKSIVKILEKNGVQYIVCVPCQEISELLKAICKNKAFQVILPCREDEGLGILLGLKLSGKHCLGLFQDTLLGNSHNAIGFIARCTNINLTLWLASREGLFLKENLVHEYITRNFPNLTADTAISTSQIFLNMQHTEALSVDSTIALSQSINSSETSFNIVQLVVS